MRGSDAKISGVEPMADWQLNGMDWPRWYLDPYSPMVTDYFDFVGYVVLPRKAADGG